MPDKLKDGYIWDYISGRQVKATSEEVEAVQPFAKRLVEDFEYPKHRIITHPQYNVRRRPSDSAKSYPIDIAIFTEDAINDDNLYIIVECKQPKKEDGLEQL
jgi:type I restriction enzyme M protein